MSIPQDQIDPDAQKIVRRLTRGGFTAYLVGGCVRDLLLGRTPKDFDIATSATPQEIKSLFRNCRIIGRRFRLAHIFFGSKIIETSTFRANPREDFDEQAEAPTLDGEIAIPRDVRDREEPEELLIRRDNVFGSAEEDSRRRDFTINGLFYDLDADRVIDYVEGLPDLERRTVRTIGEPDIRFREDPIRILRAIKFAARLNFEIEPAAYQSILRHRNEIAKCAPPRVLEEIYRLLRGGAARRSIEILQATGVLQILIPDLAELIGREGDHEGSERFMRALEELDARVARGMPIPSNALLLCTILSPYLTDALYDPEEEMADAAGVIEELARPLLEGMKASRRDVERARQILMAQRRLFPSKKRRGRPMALARRDWFGDALTVFELMHPTPDAELAEEIGRWHRLRREAEAGGAGAHAGSSSGGSGGSGGPAPSGDEPRRRRRRRGGRNRKRGGSTGGDSGSSGPMDSSGSGSLAASRS